MLNNMCTVFVCFPGCDLVKFKINFVFLIKSFSHMTKNLGQKFKYLENESSFQGETKSIFHLL